MSDLYDIIHVALPQTPAYTTAGRLVREGNVVRYQNFTGKVGQSDIAGTLEVDTGGKRPFMKGELQSKVLDLGDLGVVVGTEEPSEKGVLPDSPFDPARWDSVDADVRIKAGTIRRPKQLPLQNLSTRIQMKDRVLTLNPLEFGIAGGKLAGPIVLDGSKDTIRADLKMRIQNLQLAQLFPTLEQNKTSVGDIGGLIELSGGGNSVARMLGSANGKIGAYMDGGEISRFMMELVALDLWDVAAVKLKGDETVADPLRHRRFRRQGRRGEHQRFRRRHLRSPGRGRRRRQPQDRGNGPQAQPEAEGQQRPVAELAALRPRHLRRTEALAGRRQARRQGRRRGRVGRDQSACSPCCRSSRKARTEESPCEQLIAEAAKSKKEATASSSDRSAASGGTAQRPPSKPAR